ncbi:hypothetical protein MMC16_004565 [Acarospora aff. strigata]|nr:hypothetical protein [Acarospora aff. strigata]
MAALPATPVSVKPPPSFTTIPGEIRNKIYELLLLFDRVDVYNCAPCCSACPPLENVPNVAILRINRQVNREASAFLYSNNTFILSTGREVMRFMTMSEDFCLYTPPTETFPTRALIRSLEVRYVADYISTDFHEERTKELWQSEEFRRDSRSRKAKHFHDEDRSASEAVWLVSGKVLRLLHGLRVLTVNLEQAFCPGGCCRLVDVAASSLGKLRRKPGLKIKVEGNLDSTEMEAVMHALSTTGLSDVTKESNRSESEGVSDEDIHSDSSDTTSSNDSDESNGSSNGDEDEDSNDSSNSHKDAGDEAGRDSKRPNISDEDSGMIDEHSESGRQETETGDRPGMTNAVHVNPDFT